MFISLTVKFTLLLLLLEKLILYFVSDDDIIVIIDRSPLGVLSKLTRGSGKNHV